MQKNFAFMFVLTLLLYLSGCVLFFNGFLPKTNHQSEKKNSKQNYDIPKRSADLRKIDRVVFVLIDALREDFVFNKLSNLPKRMPFLQKMIEQNKTFSYISIANLPTVTMPRIKAIVSGSIPSFYEIIENSISKEYSQDSIIKQLKSKSISMVFYGDNTWLKLFPNMFLRSEGTNSFYVNDFHEVDNNVTRHLDSELQSPYDWNMLILHYLGLDHIGHAQGPYSTPVAPKLKEMDSIIMKIYNNLKDSNEKSIIIVTGDHGMSNAGSHGGSSKEEINTPLVFIPTFSDGVPFIEHAVRQTDISITLSILFGTEIPKSSIGKPIQLINQLYNTDEISVIKKKLSCHLNTMIPSGISFKEILEDYCKGLHNDEKVIDRASDYLVQNSVKYNETLMVFGILVLIFIVFFTIIYHFDHSKRENYVNDKTGAFSSVIKIFVNIWLVIFQISQLSSSFIEEEHYLYFYALPSFIILVSFTQKALVNKYTLTLLVLLRISKEWNRTGVKWLILEDIENFFLRNPSCLVLFIISGFMLVLWIKRTHFKDIFAIISLALVTIYKLCGCTNNFHGFVCCQRSQMNIAKLVYVLLLVKIIIQRLEREAIKSAFLVLALLLLRSTNYPWFCLLILSENIFTTVVIPHLIDKRANRQQLFFIYLTVSRFFHFSQGNSNSFATVDVAAGMIGFTEYHEILSVVISFVATYASLIYWTMSFFIGISKAEPESTKYFGVNLLMYQLVETTFYTIVVFLMRYHLFIWSVFAPKYFFMLAQSCLNLFFTVPIFLFSN